MPNIGRGNEPWLARSVLVERPGLRERGHRGGGGYLHQPSEVGTTRREVEGHSSSQGPQRFIGGVSAVIGSTRRLRVQGVAHGLADRLGVLVADRLIRRRGARQGGARG